ncbi:uncharacterized protein LOC119991502 [Tripterygium wilfordii]|uniref:uncharacterized protein LOC119991502 n=1 Tax=Tripterygium wilfordii TaxID=458696 RepID=UPI0018F8267F|nr:uncharacterized protein LOC119991502 [Tripterygium wilfordii]
MDLDEALIVPRATVLVRFNGEVSHTIGEITLPVYANGVNKQTKFSVLDSPSAYNIILGRPWLHSIGVVPSTYYQVLRYPTKSGVKEPKEERKVESMHRLPFPLSHIDMMVDLTAGHGLLSFMDAFSGYNQILMHPEDQEKMAFITERVIYYYKVMPFHLKNVESTYE